MVFEATISHIKSNGSCSAGQCTSLDFVEVLTKLFEHESECKVVVLKGLAPSLSQKAIITAWRFNRVVVVVRDDIEVVGEHSYFKDNEYWLVTSIIPSQSLLLTSRLEWSVNHLGECIPFWPDDECGTIIFTSGSTGTPKGVCHSLGNVYRSAYLFANWANLDNDEHLYCLAPIHAASGFRSLILPFLTEATVSLNNNANPSFLEIVKEIQRIGATQILCGPVFVHQIAAYGKRIKDYLASVHSLLSIGAMLSSEKKVDVEQLLGIKVRNCYGLSETMGVCLADVPGDQRGDVLPSPCENVQVSLHEEKGSEDVYRLHIHSKNIFLGYLGENLCRQTNFDTGDLVIKNKDGSISLAGRSDDAYKAASTRWLYPLLLEELLKKQPGIADVLVKCVEVAGGYACEILFQSYAEEVLDQPAMEKMIISKLGNEYRPVSWVPVNIKRCPLAKVELVTRL